MATRTTKHLNGVASPGLKTDDLLALIMAARSKAAEAVPPGFKNCDQWAVEWGMSSRRASEILNEGTRLGVIERKQFRVHHNDQSLRMRPYFRALKKG